MGDLTLAHFHPVVISFLIRESAAGNIRFPSLIEEHRVLAPPNKDLRVVKVLFLTPPQITHTVGSVVSVIADEKGVVTRSYETV